MVKAGPAAAARLASRARRRRDRRRAAIWAAVAFVATVAAVIGASLAGLAEARDALPAGIVAGLSVGAFQYTRYLVREADADSAARVTAFQERVERRLAEIEGLARLAFLQPPYPLPFEPWSMAADGAALLAVEVGSARPRLTLELGSGMTTVLIGLQLQRAGQGRLVSLEHDPQWAARTRRHVAAMGLDGIVTVVDAPLVPYELDGRTYRWYSLPPELDGQVIDLLLVDGPPQRIDPDGSPRYPALPLLIDRLSTTATIYVDDARRPAERRMVESWKARFPGWLAERHPSYKGTLLLRRTAEPPLASADEESIEGSEDALVG